MTVFEKRDWKVKMVVSEATGPKIVACRA